MDATGITEKLAKLGDPSSQSSEWLTALLDGLWPHINAAAQAFAKENLPPILDQNKPSWVGSISVNRLELGHENPKIGNFRVIKGEEPMKDLAIELDFVWYSKQDIEITVQLLPDDSKYLPSFLDSAMAKMSTFTFGIEHMEFDGRIRTTLRPLLDVLPVAGAVQVSFVERPHVSFTLTWGKGSEEDKWSPVIMNWLIKVVDSYIAGAMLLPDHFTVKMQPDVPDLHKFDGILDVTVLGATNAPKGDWLSKSDLYIEMYLREKKKFRTKEVESTPPQWNQSFELIVMEELHQELIVTLFDNDVGYDDELGRGSIFVRDLPRDAESNITLTLKPPPQMKQPEPGKECTLTLAVKYTRFTKEEMTELVKVQYNPKEYVIPNSIQSGSILHNLLTHLKEVLSGEVPKPITVA